MRLNGPVRAYTQGKNQVAGASKKKREGEKKLDNIIRQLILITIIITVFFR